MNEDILIGSNGLCGRLVRSEPADHHSFPWILLLHGIGTDSREFGVFPDFLSKLGITSLLLDFSGHGKSSGRKGFISHQSHLMDTLKGVQYLTLRFGNNGFILGHSFGAHAALRIASDDNLSDHINGIIIIAPQLKSGNSLTALKYILFKFVGMIYRRFPCMPDFFVTNKTNFNSIFYNTKRLNIKPENFIAPTLNLAVTGYASQADNRKLMCRLKKPALVVSCADDSQIPPIHGKLLADFNPLAQYYLHPEAGHSPFIEENSGLLADKIAEFIFTILNHKA